MVNVSVQNNSENFRRLFLIRFTKELIKNSMSGTILELEDVLEKQEDLRKLEIKQEVSKRMKIAEQPKGVLTPEYMKSIMGRESAEKSKEVSPQFVKKTEDISEQDKGKVSPQFVRKSKEIPEAYQEKSVIFEISKEQPSAIPQAPKKIEKIKPMFKPLIIPEPVLPPNLQYLKPTIKDVKIDLGKLNPLISDPMVSVIECAGPDKNIIIRGKMGTKSTEIILSIGDIDNIIITFSKLSKIPVQQGIFRVVVGRYIFSAIISDVVDKKFVIKKMSVESMWSQMPKQNQNFFPQRQPSNLVQGVFRR